MCRFDPKATPKQTLTPAAYEIYPPCSLPLSDTAKLSLVGGERREPGDVSPLKPRKEKTLGKSKEMLQAAE